MNKKSLDVIIPIYYGNYNEISDSLRILHTFLKNHMTNYNWTIIIGLNGPNKHNIKELCESLVKKYSNVKLSYTKSPGRGTILNKTWFNSKSDYVSYMDVDLSTDLKDFPLMIKELKDYDLCVGSRYLKTSKKTRYILRHVISKVYNDFFTKFLLNAKFTDAQCGFKSARKDVSRKIIPLIKDHNWFWDTEFLYLCQKKKYNLKEVPVVWKEKSNSGVKIPRTIFDFIIKSFGLRFRKI